MTSATTRRRILDAALACFVEDGYERTSTARIIERSGVSNGALFHHFHSKEAIADALYVDAISSFQEGVWELLRWRPRTLRAALRRMVGHQLRWTEEHADLARFVYSRGHLEWDSPAVPDVDALNRSLAAALRDWLAPLIRRGEIRPMSMLLLTAIVSGPAHAIARRWLAGRLDRPPSAWLDELSDAASAAVRGAPVRARGTRPPAPHLGRLTLELVDDAGTVLAHGRATTELVLETPSANP